MGIFKKGWKKVIVSILIVAITLANVGVPTKIHGYLGVEPKTSHEQEVPEGYIGIYTKEELSKINENLAGNFILMNNINFTESDFREGGNFFNEGKGWKPIGSTSKNAFTGTLNGNGYYISGLHIKGVYTNNETLGLVGFNKGILEKLAVINSIYDITYTSQGEEGGNEVGGIAGNNSSTIRESSFGGSITVQYELPNGAYRTGYGVGGVAGSNSYGTIRECYNAANILAEYSCAGGLAGKGSHGKVYDCYNTGAIYGTSRGGIVGNNYYGTIERCYNNGNADLLGSSYSGGIAGFNKYGTIVDTYYYELNQYGISGTQDDETTIKCTTEQMKEQSTYLTFDFSDIWTMNTSDTYHYPVLKNVSYYDELMNNQIFEAGDGTAVNPYQIKSKEQLQYVYNNLGAYYILMEDIEFSAEDFLINGDFYNNGYGWTPIGNNVDKPFYGMFDGNGHTIKNIVMVAESQQYIGMGIFGHSEGIVKNLHILNISIIIGEMELSDSERYAGSIVGRNTGRIENCSSYGGKISGKSSKNTSTSFGGIVGVNSGIVKGCWNTSTIHSETNWDNVGGIAGRNHNTIKACYNKGKLSANGRSGNNVGGIVGYSFAPEGSIDDCYNTGTVKGNWSRYDSSTGGIAGYSDYTTISNTYNIGNVSGPRAGGIIGYVPRFNTLSGNVYLDTITCGISNETVSETMIKRCSLEEMKNKEVYAEFDFDSIWVINVNTTPYLQRFEYKEVSSISFESSLVKIGTNGTHQTVVHTAPYDATFTNIQYSSSNDDIVTIDKDGRITGHRIGNAYVYATDEISKKTTACRVYVEQGVESLQISLPAEVYVGDSVQIQVDILPVNAANKQLVWFVSDESIATITKDGVITGVKGGIVEVFAAATDGTGRMAGVTLQVGQKVTGIQLEKQQEVIKVNETKTLVADVLPLEATYKAIHWTSQDETVAIVDVWGNVTGMGSGNTTVIATTMDGGFKASCEIEVIQQVTGIELNFEDHTISVGKTAELVATVTPENANNKTIVWSSSSEAVEVTQDGIIKGIKEGEAIVTATAVDGNKSTSCFVIVEKEIESIVITKTPSKLEFNYGEQIQVDGEVTIYYMDGALTTIPILSNMLSGYDSKQVGNQTITVEYLGHVVSYDVIVNPLNIEGYSLVGIEDKEYTGSEVVQSFQVFCGEVELKEGTDYVTTYENNIDVGQVTLVVKGRGIYTGDIVVTFEINRKSLDTVSVELLQNSYVFTGEAITPLLSVYDDKKELVENSDYTVLLSDHVDVGTATVMVIGKGNYEGEITKTYNISLKAINDLNIAIDHMEYVYDGTEMTPIVSMKHGYYTLTIGKDYEVSYVDNINVGSATVVVTGIGNYMGVRNIPFIIMPKSIKDIAIVGEETEYVYDGTSHMPNIEIVDGTVVLLESKDYLVRYMDNVNAGVGTIIIEGQGNYTGETSMEFMIMPKAMDELEMVLSEQSFIYDGTEKKPAVAIQYNGMTLVEEIDFVVEYSNNIECGKAAVSVRGIENYCGKLEQSFTIRPQHIFNEEWTVDRSPTCILEGEKSRHCLDEGCIEKTDITTIPVVEHTWNEGVITRVPTCRETGIKTYTCKLCGTTKMEEITALGHSFEEKWTIDREATCTEEGEMSQRCLNKGCDERTEVTVIPVKEHMWDEGVITKAATCTEAGEITYTCKESGTTRRDKIEAFGHKYGEEWTIDKEATCTETGEKSHHCLNNGCIERNDITVIQVIEHIWGDGKLTKLPTCTESGFEIYTCVECEETREEAIEPHGHNSSDWMVSHYQTYDNEGREYKVCHNCNEVLEERAIPKLIRSYINKAIVTLNKTNFVYSGSAQNPAVTVTLNGKTLRLNQDYKVIYSNNVNKGTAAVTITAIGEYQGSIKKTYTISAFDISKASISGISNKSFTGNAVIQSITIKHGNKQLTIGKDYKVTYSNNVNPGTATIRIIGLVNYAGYVNRTYTIIIPKVSNMKFVAVKTTTIKVSWNKQNGVSGYVLERYNISKKKYEVIKKTISTSFTDTKLKAGTGYKYRVRSYKVVNKKIVYGSYSNVLVTGTKPDTVTSVKLKAKAGKKITISWKKVPNASGYEIFAATSKSGKYSLVKYLNKNSTVSYTHSKLTANKTYYYKVRSYKVVNGKKVYGDYSKVVSVKAKK